MFEDLNDEELAAKIVEIRDAIVKLSIGGDVQVIWAENRRLEYTRGNIAEARNLLNIAKRELKVRTGEATYGQAIGVRIY